MLDIERRPTLYTEEVEDLLETPAFFGADGQERRKTLITDEPLEIPYSDFAKLRDITQGIVRFIDRYQLLENRAQVGTELPLMNDAIRFDQSTGSKMVYGGLDIYKTPSGEFKVIEINSHAQAMGLQDFRLGSLGIYDQPMTVMHFINNLHNSGYERAAVIGSRKNAFWRAHNRVSNLIGESGIESRYLDTQSFQGLCESGFTPDVIIRFCSSRHLLYHNSSAFLKKIAIDQKLPIINATSAAFFGYRGFLKQVSEELPDHFPIQIEATKDVTEDQLHEYPWLKLESPNIEYVTNYKAIRRWTKNALVSLIQRDFERFDDCVSGKVSRESELLRSIRQDIQSYSDSCVKWIAQEDLEPSVARVSFEGKIEELKLLYRAYWVKNDEQDIDVSIEGYGCTSEQFSRSRGKINGGTGISVPMTIN